ncbi:MAG: NUDIX domain-containing protein [Rikenellaceae bacterium]
MQIDIYFATKRLTISDSPSGNFTIESGFIERDYIIDILEQFKEVTIVTPNPEALYKNFAAQFTEVVAAGGVVQNDDSRLLMIHRNERWDLPKGHWEEGETIEECAIREVEEESGVGGITLGEKICETLHAYSMRGRWEIKTTHWYAMANSDKSELKPQTEEGIDRAKWCKREKIEKKLKGSFPTIKSVMGRYLEMFPN